jgi:hypothetical protein
MPYGRSIEIMESILSAGPVTSMVNELVEISTTRPR